ncbi:MAG TPA: winged helix DNA-binding domain-containing protein [Amycolatopsis sp.]|uniref:winged helix DNA-binding domain-containing protein n=1 Tax=Amycolatopsis sp. TaxID=37632 RepID=UPI002B485E15|nr:winged helix DNA-binding domain-containing protein [Amycolatopsis sp.]HKS46750.1 winged helix DNA-binding domain-containing protein [Amycolatopsis sp.]
MTERISLARRRARLATRHHLAGEAASPEQVAESLVALHATDPATVHLSVAARSSASTGEIERALYEERTLLRMLGMRRTMFVVPAGLAPVVQVACAGDIAVRQRKLLIQHLGTAGLDTDLDKWLADVEEGTYAALKARGAAHAQQIAADEPRLRTQILLAEGKPYESRGYITNRVLFLLAAQGRIVRGRPRGSWLSTQYSWATADSWLPGEVVRPNPDQARAELARRWLRAFGPAPVSDLKWWTGWGATQLKKALAAIGPVEVDLDGTTGVALPGDLERVPEAEPVAALLPALDPTPMGWRERGWFLGGHEAALFDRTGNIGPTVWWAGRVVGAWAQRPGGELAYRLFEDVGADAVAAIEARVARLAGWLGEARVTPKFRTPAEKALAT